MFVSSNNHLAHILTKSLRRPLYLLTFVTDTDKYDIVECKNQDFTVKNLER